MEQRLALAVKPTGASATQAAGAHVIWPPTLMILLLILYVIKVHPVLPIGKIRQKQSRSYHSKYLEYCGLFSEIPGYLMSLLA